MIDPFVFSIAIDPGNPNTIYAGIFKSANGGQSWTVSNSGLPDAVIRVLRIDPSNPATIYAGSALASVFKSTNGGRSWTAANSGITPACIEDLAVDPANSATLYAAISAGGNCPLLSGVFKSNNGGASWTEVNSGITDLQVLSLAVEPSNTNVLYAGTRLHGIFKTTNAGASWSLVKSGLLSTSFGVSHLPIVVDPLKPGTVYAGTVNGVFKSADSGMNWTSTNTGFPASTNVFALAIEPAAAPRKEQDFIWARAMGGRGSPFSWASDVAVDSSGNVYTVGFFEGNADFDPGPGTFNLTSAGRAGDIFVSKLDSAGNFLWARAMGGPSPQEEQLLPNPNSASGVALDGSGNVYATGIFEGTVDFDPGPGTFNLTSAGIIDIFVLKLDSTGSFVWARAMGGAFFDAATDVALDGSGNIYTVGWFEGIVDFDPGPLSFSLTSLGRDDFFVSKLDSAGDFVWARAMGGPDSDAASGIALDGSSNVYTVGGFEGTVDLDPGPGTFNLTTAGDGNITSLGQADIFVSKLDSAGNFIWARAMGGPFADEATGVALDGSGNVYTVGGFRGTADFDPGRLSFNLTNAGGQNSTQLDIFVSKLDTAGNFIWARAMGSRFGEAASDIALDRSGNSYAVGTFEDTIDFDPGPLTYILNAEGDYSIFVSKLDSAGNFGWAGSIGGPFSQDVSGVELDSAGNVYTVGAFQGTGDFDPGPGVFNLTTPGDFDIFVCKIRPPENPPRTNLSVETLSFTAEEAGSVPSQSFEIRNMGGGTLNYQVATNRPWLSVAPEQGNSAGETDTIEVSVNTDGLRPATHKGTITISESLPAKTVSPILQSPPAPTISVNLVVTSPVSEVTPQGIVNGASFTPFAAPASIMSLFGAGLAEATETATSTPLPTTLAGTTVTVTDRTGLSRTAELFFVSAGQINFLMPEEMALGFATVTVTREDGISGAITVELEAVAPALFSALADGTGVAAASYLRVSADDSRTEDLIFDPNTRGSVPVDLGPEGDQVFLLLFGTGVRGFSSQVTVVVGGENVPVLGAVPQGQFVGLDQINAGPLPRSLVGRGEVGITMTVDGKTANTVSVNIQ